MNDKSVFELDSDGFVQLTPLGEFFHKGAGVTQVIDAEACAAMVADFKARMGQENFPGVLVDFDHFSLDTDKPSEAAGWIEDMEARPDGLWAKVRWSDSGRAAVTGGRFRLVSPVFRHPGGTVDLGGNRVRPVMVDSVALTNAPNIKGGKPIANRDPGPEGFDFASTQFDLPQPLSDRVRALGALVAEADLHVQGRENEPHVTALYGLRSDDVEAVRQAVKGCGPVVLTLGPLSVFNVPEKGFDVLKLAVEPSESLLAVRKALEALDHETSMFPVYEPHVTLAYLKPGCADKYCVPSPLDGASCECDTLTFSAKDNKHTPVPLTGSLVNRKVGKADEDKAKASGTVVGGPKAAKFMWLLGAPAKGPHCKECEGRHGKVKTLLEWMRLPAPKCNCYCTLAEVGKDVPVGYDPGPVDVNTPALANRGSSAFEFVDRYSALGIEPPSVDTCCNGRCEGCGVFPLHLDSAEDPALRALWDAAEDEEPSPDGWHFVTCPDCGGSGKRDSDALANRSSKGWGDKARAASLASRRAKASARKAVGKWDDAALSMIRTFEGYRGTAYPDPATGGAPWTVGWGSTTRLDGTPVEKGDRVSRKAADERLAAVVQEFSENLADTVPWDKLTDPQRASLVSWAYNVGFGNVRASTLVKRLNAGESAGAVIAEELPKWRKASGKTMAGLEKRRAAEVRMAGWPSLANREVPAFGALPAAIPNRWSKPWGDKARAASLAVRRAKAAVRAALSPAAPDTRPNYKSMSTNADGSPAIRDLTDVSGFSAGGKPGISADDRRDWSDLSITDPGVDPMSVLTDIPRTDNPVLDGGLALIGGLTMIGGARGGSKSSGLTAVQKSIRRKADRQVTLDKVAAREYRELQKRGSFPPPRTDPVPSVGRKVLDATTAPFTASRSVITAFDLSAALRQGGILSLANPNAVPAALASMFKSFASEKLAVKEDSALKTRPNAGLYKHSGLYLTDGPTGVRTKHEEVFCSSLAEKVPGVKISERSYNAYLNRIRADVFDSLVSNLCETGTPTTKEMKAIANFVNVSTGRGDLGKLNGAAAELSTVFFAPRLVASRFEFLTGQPAYGGSMRTRKLVAEQYARYLVGMAIVYGLAKAGGADVEFDPRSSDFGKLRFDDTRVDVLSGLGQSAVVTSRLTSGQYKTIGGKVFDLYGDVPSYRSDAGDVALRFGRTKLSPLYGAAVNAWAGTNVNGEPVTLGSTVFDMTVPLVARDVYEVFKEKDVPEATALSLASIFGAGVAVFEERARGKPGLSAKPSHVGESASGVLQKVADFVSSGFFPPASADDRFTKAEPGSKTACYICGKEGHWARSCPERGKSPKKPKAAAAKDTSAVLTEDIVVDPRLTILAGTTRRQADAIIARHKAGKFMDSTIDHDQRMRSLGSAAAVRAAERAKDSPPKEVKPKRVKKMTKKEKIQAGSVILTNRWSKPWGDKARAASLAVRRAKAAARAAASQPTLSASAEAALDARYGTVGASPIKDLSAELPEIPQGTYFDAEDPTFAARQAAYAEALRQVWDKTQSTADNIMLFHAIVAAAGGAVAAGSGSGSPLGAASRALTGTNYKTGRVGGYQAVANPDGSVTGWAKVSRPAYVGRSSAARRSARPAKTSAVVRPPADTTPPKATAPVQGTFSGLDSPSPKPASVNPGLIKLGAVDNYNPLTDPRTADDLAFRASYEKHLDEIRESMNGSSASDYDKHIADLRAADEKTVSPAWLEPSLAAPLKGPRELWDDIYSVGLSVPTGLRREMDRAADLYERGEYGSFDAALPALNARVAAYVKGMGGKPSTKAVTSPAADPDVFPVGKSLVQQLAEETAAEALAVYANPKDAVAEAIAAYDIITAFRPNTDTEHELYEGVLSNLERFIELQKGNQIERAVEEGLLPQVRSALESLRLVTKAGVDPVSKKVAGSVREIAHGLGVLHGQYGIDLPANFPIPEEAMAEYQRGVDEGKKGFEYGIVPPKNRAAVLRSVNGYLESSSFGDGEDFSPDHLNDRFNLDKWAREDSWAARNLKPGAGVDTSKYPDMREQYAVENLLRVSMDWLKDAMVRGDKEQANAALRYMADTMASVSASRGAAVEGSAGTSDKDEDEEGIEADLSMPEYDEDGVEIDPGPFYADEIQDMSARQPWENVWDGVGPALHRSGGRAYKRSGRVSAFLDNRTLSDLEKAVRVAAREYHLRMGGWGRTNDLKAASARYKELVATDRVTQQDYARQYREAMLTFSQERRNLRSSYLSGGVSAAEYREKLGKIVAAEAERRTARSGQLSFRRQQAADERAAVLAAALRALAEKTASVPPAPAPVPAPENAPVDPVAETVAPVVPPTAQPAPSVETPVAGVETPVFTPPAPIVEDEDPNKPKGVVVNRHTSACASASPGSPCNCSCGGALHAGGGLGFTEKPMLFGGMPDKALVPPPSGASSDEWTEYAGRIFEAANGRRPDTVGDWMDAEGMAGVPSELRQHDVGGKVIPAVVAAAAKAIAARAAGGAGAAAPGAAAVPAAKNAAGAANPAGVPPAVKKNGPVLTRRQRAAKEKRERWEANERRKATAKEQLKAARDARRKARTAPLGSPSGMVARATQPGPWVPQFQNPNAHKAPTQPPKKVTPAGAEIII